MPTPYPFDFEPQLISRVLPGEPMRRSFELSRDIFGVHLLCAFCRVQKGPSCSAAACVEVWGKLEQKIRSRIGTTLRAHTSKWSRKVSKAFIVKCHCGNPSCFFILMSAHRWSSHSFCVHLRIVLFYKLDRL